MLVPLVPAAALVTYGAAAPNVALMVAGLSVRTGVYPSLVRVEVASPGAPSAAGAAGGCGCGGSGGVRHRRRLRRGGGPACGEAETGGECDSRDSEELAAGLHDDVPLMWCGLRARPPWGRWWPGGELNSACTRGLLPRSVPVSVRQPAGPGQGGRDYAHGQRDGCYRPVGCGHGVGGGFGVNGLGGTDGCGHGFGVLMVLTSLKNPGACVPGLAVLLWSCTALRRSGV